MDDYSRIIMKKHELLRIHNMDYSFFSIAQINFTLRQDFSVTFPNLSCLERYNIIQQSNFKRLHYHSVINVKINQHSIANFSDRPYNCKIYKKVFRSIR